MRTLHCIILAMALAAASQLAAAHSSGSSDHYYTWNLSGNCDNEAGSPSQVCAMGCSNCSPANAPCYSNDEDDGTSFSCLNKNDIPLTWPTKSVHHCPPGETYDDQNFECVPPCPPCHTRNPQTQACEFVCEGQEFCNDQNQCELPLQCPEGKIPFTIGTNTQCVEPLGQPDECDDVEGYALSADGTQTQVCGIDRESCEAEGGTYGLIDNTPTCLSPDYGDDLPTCEAGTINVIGGDGQGIACSSVDPTDDPDNPDVPNSEESDTDGDGTPDSQDDDIDGDGTPNSQDNDRDGDGIPNADDPSPDGDQSSVSGGGSCGSRPQCTGDPVQCGILYQTWAARCEDKSQSNNEFSGGGNCDAPPSCSGNVILCGIAEQTWRNRCEGFIETQDQLDQATDGLEVSTVFGDDVDLTDDLQNIFTAGSSSGTCPADKPFTVAGASIPISYQPFCDLASIINPMVLILFSFFALRTVWSAF